MSARVGSAVMVDSRVPGRPPRAGRIVEVLGEQERPHYRVRWDDGHESVYYPGPDGHVASAAEPDVTEREGLHPRLFRLRGTVDGLMAQVPRMPAGSTLREVAVSLAGSSGGAVLVYEGEELAGIVTDRDLVRSLAGGADADEVWAADVVPAETVLGSPDDTIVASADVMVRAGIHHLPLARDGQVVGMIDAPRLLAAVLGTDPAPAG